MTLPSSDVAEPTERQAYEAMRRNCSQLGDGGLDLIFRQARTHHTWIKEPVTEDDIRRIYDVMKNGPTSTNSCPGRFAFVISQDEKERLAECVDPGNRDKVLTAPAIAIAAIDPSFWTFMPKLFPHMDRSAVFKNDPALAQDTANRNATLQAAYFMIAARALGFDVGAMSGFSKEKVDQAFLAERQWKSNFLITLGRGDPAGLFGKLPRLKFEDACSVR